MAAETVEPSSESKQPAKTKSPVKRAARTQTSTLAKPQVEAVAAHKSKRGGKTKEMNLRM